MLTREQILAKKLSQEVIDLPSGGQVKVRGLTRDEALLTQDREGTAARDNYVIATGLLDPKLTEDDVAAWAATGATGDLNTISLAIAHLSGMGEGAGKSGVAELGE